MEMTSSIARVLTLLFGALSATPALPALAQDLFLTNARIVDPAAQAIRQANLLILEGVITGSPERAPVGFRGQTIDLAGKWVIPGLNDMHTHAYGNMAGDAYDGPGTEVVSKRMLYAGVTGFLDLFGREDVLYRLRASQRAGEVGGADLYTSLSCLTATEGHCTEYGIETRTMDSPEEAAAVVADLATKNPDVVKIIYSPSGRMPSIDRPTLAAAVATASQHGIRTVIHVDTWDDVRDAVEVGASAVTHVPHSEPMPEALGARMAEMGVVSIPTLAAYVDLPAFIFDEAILANELATDLTTPEIIAAYRSDKLVNAYEAWRERSRSSRGSILANVKAMSDAGVTILTGTDSGNLATIQGYSEHRELVLLVEAGLPPWDALAAATTRAGEFLGQSFGVNPGDSANLVVLEASPIDDIANTQHIAMVIQHGVVVDREALLAGALD
jgi:imidazolonepropionase-like amidohydrolase